MTWSISIRMADCDDWQPVWSADGPNAEVDTRARFDAFRAGFAGKPTRIRVDANWIAARLFHENDTVSEVERDEPTQQDVNHALREGTPASE